MVSGAAGVQGHTVTLLRLLKRYKVPVFLFINKMDREGTEREQILSELKERLDEGCVDIGRLCSGQSAADKGGISGEAPDCLEDLAVCDDRLLSEYLETGTISRASIKLAMSVR